MLNIPVIENASCVNKNINGLKDAAQGLKCRINFIFHRNVALEINDSNLWILCFELIEQMIGFRLNINDGQILKTIKIIVSLINSILFRLSIENIQQFHFLIVYGKSVLPFRQLRQQRCTTDPKMVKKMKTICSINVSSKTRTR